LAAIIMSLINPRRGQKHRQPGARGDDGIAAAAAPLRRLHSPNIQIEPDRKRNRSPAAYRLMSARGRGRHAP
jgi:hypothetical protein